MVDTDRLVRTKQRTIIKCDAICKRINHIHLLYNRVALDPTLIHQLTVGVEDLNGLWNNFLVENDAVLDILLELDQLDEFSHDLEMDLHALVYMNIKTLVNNSYEINDVVSVSHSSTKYQASGKGQ